MGKEREGDPILANVLGASSQGHGKRSPLYVWMRRHFAALNEEFEAHGPNWTERVKRMGEAGLTDREGKPPTIRTAQQTWYRLKQDMARKAAKPLANPVPVRAVRVAPAVEAGADDADPKPTSKFGFAKLRE
ncbi:hypothetical protein [Roseomonas mucosa]|uniref:hypothetical protein n=1 Tax=Roseomonas mucosa TaxID=207340 RepID=UPI0022486AD3|nr:hypothetical protein [Roseomonas mucosa]UZO91805.1 Hypothetical protein RMP42_05971 [Roseomonas mucosa]